MLHYVSKYYQYRVVLVVGRRSHLVESRRYLRNKFGTYESRTMCRWKRDKSVGHRSVSNSVAGLDAAQGNGPARTILNAILAILLNGREVSENETFATVPGNRFSAIEGPPPFGSRTT